MIVPNLLDSEDFSEPANEMEEEPVAEAEEPVSEEAPEAEPINWAPVMWGAGALLGVAAVGGAGTLSYKAVKASKVARRKRKEAKEEEQYATNENIRRWDNLRVRHQGVLSDYAAYETDIWKALQYPSIHDVNVKETSSFIKQMKDTRNISREQKNRDKGSIGGTDELFVRYEKSVNELEYRFEIAESRAVKKKLGTLPSGEKKEIEQAIKLLNHAENEGNTPQARKTYYEKLKKIINNLNERHGSDLIPVPTVHLIEEKTQLMITDGNENNLVNDSIGVNSLLDIDRKEKSPLNTSKAMKNNSK